MKACASRTRTGICTSLPRTYRLHIESALPHAPTSDRSTNRAAFTSTAQLEEQTWPMARTAAPPQAATDPRPPIRKRSGAGVGLIVDIFQALDRYVGVELSSRHAGVTEEFLYYAQVRAALE